MNLRTQPGFLGTEAGLLADLTLLAYLLLLLPLMAAGYYYARRKRFEPHHKVVMTTITTLNWLLILFVMAVSFNSTVAPEIPENLNDLFVLLPAVHAIIGGIAQVIATYLVVRMWFELRLPQWSLVTNIKRYMRLTLTLWVVTALLGILIYVTWYSGTTTPSAEVPAPASTQEPGLAS